MRRLLLVLVLMELIGSSTQAFYDASVGRWLNRDPLGERGFEAYHERNDLGTGAKAELHAGVNLYQFVANHPTIAIDPDGRAAVIVIAVGGGVVVVSVACLVSPPCREALGNLLRELAKEACRRWPEPPYPKDCDKYRDACIGSGQDCFSCWRECQSTGAWPTYKCDPSKYKF